MEAHKQLIAILLSDFYKQCHMNQYDKRITKLVNYYTPRSTRIKEWEYVPVIGIQKWIKEYLIDNFYWNFFSLALNDVLYEYEYIITETLGPEHVDLKRITALHNLGYLPLDIRALEEGTKCPIGCPIIEVSNTHDDFAWLVNNIETVELSELWYPMITTRVGIEYRETANEYYEKTCDNPELARSAVSDFCFRSVMGTEAANKASMGMLASFNKTATIPVITNLRYNYGDSLKSIATGTASTEHSVMCSSFAIDGDEISCVKRLLTEVHPTGKLSMVSDSYDYWNMINNLIPACKEEILNRDGVLYPRGDSGDPVEITTKTVFALWETFGGTTNSKGYKVLDSHIRVIYGDSITPIRQRKIYQILMDNGFSVENVALGAGGFSMLCREEDADYYNGTMQPSKGTRLQPFTRDTFGVAIKTTWGEYKRLGPSIEHENGLCTSDLVEKKVGFDIFKDPKTDTNKLKKSQKGCCRVMNVPWINATTFESGETITFVDGLTLEEAHNESTEGVHLLANLLKPVFLNGKLIRETSFNEIRNRLWNNQF